MENMEMNEIITTEAMEDTMTEAVASGKNGVKTGLVIGGSMFLGALLYERVVKPVGHKIGTKIAGKMAARKAKKAETVNLDDMDIEDIPDID